MCDNETKDAKEEKEKSVSEIRKDFIKRLFAVAVSVGFASTLIQMDWIVNSSLPVKKEWEHLLVLLVGLVATVGSWDGYFQALEKAPLHKFNRFLIDIILVFSYLILLVTSKNHNLWIILLLVIYLLYWLWDMLSVIEHEDKFFLDGVRHPHITKFEVLKRVYIGGFHYKADVNKGPVITLIWTTFFAIQTYVFFNTSNHNTIALAIVNICVLVLYRIAKANRDALTRADKYAPYMPILVLLTMFMVAALV